MAITIYIIVAIVVGVAGGMQVLVNTSLDRTADLPLTTLVVNLISGLTVLAVYLIFSRQSFSVLKEADWYSFFGGVMGVIIVMGSTFLIPRLGITVATSIIIVSQLTFGMIADHYGLLGIRHIAIDPSRLLAVLLMVVGLYLFFK